MPRGSGVVNKASDSQQTREFESEKTQIFCH